MILGYHRPYIPNSSSPIFCGYVGDGTWCGVFAYHHNAEANGYDLRVVGSIVRECDIGYHSCETGTSSDGYGFIVCGDVGRYWTLNHTTAVGRGLFCYANSAGGPSIVLEYIGSIRPRMNWFIIYKNEVLSVFLLLVVV